MVPVHPISVSVLLALVVVTHSATWLGQVENCSGTFCPNVLKVCARILVALPLLVLGVKVTEPLARVLAAVPPASDVEDLPAAVAARPLVDTKGAAPPRLTVLAPVVSFHKA